MQRIVIIGCSGSGKSTLTRILGQRLGLPVTHLDQVFWRAGWVNVDQETFDAKLAQTLETPAWIIDGNFDRTLVWRLSRCDTAIYLDYPRALCLYGVLTRVLSSYGKTRPDMASGCPERLDWAFLKWIWHFNRTHRPGNLAALQDAEQAGVTVLRFTRRHQCKRWLAKLPPQTPEK